MHSKGQQQYTGTQRHMKIEFWTVLWMRFVFGMLYGHLNVLWTTSFFLTSFYILTWSLEIMASYQNSFCDGFWDNGLVSYYSFDDTVTSMAVDSGL